MNAMKLILAAVAAFGVSTGSAKADESSTKSLLKSAQAAKDEKDFAAAIALYDKVLTRDRENMEAIRSMAWIRNDQGKFDLAMFWVKEGLAVESDDGELLTEGGFASWKLGETKAAKKYLARAIAARPKVATSYNYLGKILKDEGDYKAAIKVDDLMTQNNAK